MDGKSVVTSSSERSLIPVCTLMDVSFTVIHRSSTQSTIDEYNRVGFRTTTAVTIASMARDVNAYSAQADTIMQIVASGKTAFVYNLLKINRDIGSTPAPVYRAPEHPSQRYALQLQLLPPSVGLHHQSSTSPIFLHQPTLRHLLRRLTVHPWREK